MDKVIELTGTYFVVIGFGGVGALLGVSSL